MTTQHELDRQLDAFLREGPTELPDPSFDAVRDRIEGTQQRSVIGPWRLPTMNKLVAHRPRRRRRGRGPRRRDADTRVPRIHWRRRTPISHAIAHAKAVGRRAVRIGCHGPAGRQLICLDQRRWRPGHGHRSRTRLVRRRRDHDQG